MKLPNAAIAVIGEAKVRDYLLSPTHPIGRHKARVFARLGYSQDRWHELEADLRAQHLVQDVENTSESPYGPKYRIRAILIGPAGVSAEIVSVWIIKTGESVPQLVTAMPGDTP